MPWVVFRRPKESDHPWIGYVVINEFYGLTPEEYLKNYCQNGERIDKDHTYTYEWLDSLDEVHKHW